MNEEFVALGHAGSEHYAGLESFPNPGVALVEMTSDAGETTRVALTTFQQSLAGRAQSHLRSLT